jgi:molybdopterin-guanine dinucleotide biosynthesis protein A
MDAVVLAGGKPDKSDPLYNLSGDQPKSLVNIAGKPMVQWVLDALSGSKRINTVVVIGLKENSSLTCSKPLVYVDDSGSLIGNLQLGAAHLLNLHPQESHVVSLSADIPAVTAQIIDHMVEIYSRFEFDIYYSIVSRQVMEARFRGSKRTYLKAKGIEVCGGDVNCYSKAAALDPNGLWTDLIAARKNPLKQAAIIGLDTFVLLALRLLSLEKAVERVCRKMGITGKTILTPYAEIAMDVDKPFQFEMVEKDLLR